MTLAKKKIAAMAVTATLSLAVPAAAAPLSQSLSGSDGAIHQIQYRGQYGGGYYAYGAEPEGYYAYGAVPGGSGAYGAAPRYRNQSLYYPRNFGNGGSATSPGSARDCPSDREQASAYPSWMCR